MDSTTTLLNAITAANVQPLSIAQPAPVEPAPQFVPQQYAPPPQQTQPVPQQQPMQQPMQQPIPQQQQYPTQAYVQQPIYAPVQQQPQQQQLTMYPPPPPTKTSSRTHYFQVRIPPVNASIEQIKSVLEMTSTAVSGPGLQSVKCVVDCASQPNTYELKVSTAATVGTKVNTDTAAYLREVSARLGCQPTAISITKQNREEYKAACLSTAPAPEPPAKKAAPAPASHSSLPPPPPSMEPIMEEPGLDTDEYVVEELPSKAAKFVDPNEDIFLSHPALASEPVPEKQAPAATAVDASQAGEPSTNSPPPDKVESEPLNKNLFCFAVGWAACALYSVYR